MRCPKCGYFSFDHLDHCRKCSKDLRSARQDLNLQDFMPEVPFLLGSLVGETQANLGGQGGLSLVQETELEFPGFDLDESSGIDETIDMERMEETIGAESGGDLELSDIALDDLDMSEGMGTVEADAAGMDLEDFPGGSGEGADPAEEGFMGLEFDLDEEGGDLTAEAPEMDLTGKGELGETLAAETTETPAESAPSKEPVLELDLSEDDLSSLAQELEDHLQDEGEAGSPAPAERKAAAEEPEPELDLSEDDFSALAQELEKGLASEPGGKKAEPDDSMSDLEEVILELEDDLEK